MRCLATPAIDRRSVLRSPGDRRFRSFCVPVWDDLADRALDRRASPTRVGRCDARSLRAACVRPTRRWCSPWRSSSRPPVPSGVSVSSPAPRFWFSRLVSLRACPIAARSRDGLSCFSSIPRSGRSSSVPARASATALGALHAGLCAYEVIADLLVAEIAVARWPRPRRSRSCPPCIRRRARLSRSRLHDRAALPRRHSPRSGSMRRIRARVPATRAARAESVPFIAAEDDLTGRPGRFTFVRCVGCAALVYQSPRLTVEHIEATTTTSTSRTSSTTVGRAGAALRRRDAVTIAPRLASSSATYLDRSHRRCWMWAAGRGRSSPWSSRGRRRDAAWTSSICRSGPALRGVEFHHGLFYDQPVGRERFDLVTMWHFLEHDYDPCARSVTRNEHSSPTAGSSSKCRASTACRSGCSRTAGRASRPRSTRCSSTGTAVLMASGAGFDVVEYLPYGAFPPYFYLFCGVAFRLLRGRGLNLIAPSIRTSPGSFCAAAAAAAQPHSTSRCRRWSAGGALNLDNEDPNCGDGRVHGGRIDRHADCRRSHMLSRPPLLLPK